MTAQTITEFISARLDEDEQIARAADTESRLAEVFGDPFIHHESAVIADHVVRHDPARVLREIAAKRAIIEEHEIKAADTRDPEPKGFGCARCHLYNPEWGVFGFGYCQTLRHLAAPYADHPDYQEEWRP